jgi:hypothetical protein
MAQVGMGKIDGDAMDSRLGIGLRPLLAGHEPR